MPQPLHLFADAAAPHGLVTSKADGLEGVIVCSPRWKVHASLGLLLAATGMAAWVVLPKRPSPTSDTSPVFSGFHEGAREAGIAFRMAFIPGEQGEKFKVNLYDHGCGVAVADYDGDGHDDVYFTNQLGPNGLYKNNGDGTFTEVTRKAGVGLGDRICVAATFADTLNSGRKDLFVTSTRGGNVFFRNQGDGTFQDATKESGLSSVGHSQTAVFFDYDNDGYLDLFVTNTARWTGPTIDSSRRYFPAGSDLFDLVGSEKEHNLLFHNNRDGTFTDVTERAGVKGFGWSGDVAVFDFDDDGYLDLFVTNMFGRSQLLRNNHKGTFTDVTHEVLRRTSFGSIGSKAFDFNNDGKLDLLMVDMHSDMWLWPPRLTFEHEAMLKEFESRRFEHITGPGIEMGKADLALERKLADLLQFRYDQVRFGNTLLKNLGGRFTEVSAKANLETFWPWGVATGDFDNNGYEDVFVASGMGYPYVYWPNRLRMNNGDETFSERSDEAGIEPPRHGRYMEEKIGGIAVARSSRCAAVADFDGDGRLDIITNNFNDHPYYFRNSFPHKNYIAFRLQGTCSNRDAIGAVLRLYRPGQVLTRQVNPAGGYLSQSSNCIHIGLGEDKTMDRIEIRWPSGLVQKSEKDDKGTLRISGTNVLPNMYHHIVEPR
jgi:enediyne biosynthesis protein E4